MASIPCAFIVFSLLATAANAACYKHVSCTSCIAESNEAGSCLWYEQPDLDGIGACIAGRPEYSPPQEGHQQLAVDAYGTWSMLVPYTGETRHFTVPEIDQVSDDSCYTTGCVQSGMCSAGYLAVENKPCYSDNVFPEWRTLKCCRQQRNINGYLRGFQADNGTIQGKLFFAACCVVCYPGQVIKGCHAYYEGYCEDCPVGRFNLFTHAGSDCEECQPCEAGRVRRRCGAALEGTCDVCEDGKYKLKGLEGAYTDPCLECEDCPDGHVRVGCGGASPGYCTPCQGSSFFAAPFCRNCMECNPLDHTRHGCGGQFLGVCTECTKGRFEDVSEACLQCAECTEAEAAEVIEGLQLTGSWARVGCGGRASGKCVRMAAGLELQDLPRCPSSVDEEALCEGSQIAARWSIQGLSSRQVDAMYADCEVTTGLCLSGFFRVKLMQRKVDAFDGVEMADLGEFFSKELQHLSGLDDPNAVMVKTGLQLPTGLPEASGYFLRVFFFDGGGSCCSAVSTTPLFADTEDFSLEGQELLVQEALELTSEDISGGHWQAAFDRVQTSCVTTATHSTWIACETAKALQLGLPVGQRALVPMPLLHSAGSTQVAAMGASFSVTQAGDRLVDLEQIYVAVVNKIPENATVWLHLMQPLFVGHDLTSAGLLENTTTTSTMFPMFTADEAKTRLELLKSGAEELATAATALHEQWASEVSSAAGLLPSKLENLQEIDRLMRESTQNATFDIVRMVQAVTWKLTHELSDLKKSTISLDAKESAMSDLLERVGSMAVLMLGTYGNSWHHGIDWRLKCQVRAEDELAWPPLMTGSKLGGAAPPAGAIDVPESKKRVFTRFGEVAEACFSYADELQVALSTSTTTSTQAPGSRRLSFSTRSLERVLPMMRKLFVEVQDFTEQVIEPLTRDGALLLAGDLPNISVPGTGSCGVRGWCLSFAGDFFDKDVILPDVWEGFGVQAIRPWIDPRIEDLRLKDASKEVLDLAFGRVRILEEILLEVVDIRHIQQQPSIGSDIASASQKLSMHLTRLLLWAEAPANVTIVSDRPDALWHWQELKRLHHALAKARRSGALLARRRLARLEALAAWVSQQRDDGYFMGPAGWSWRQPWTPWSERQAGSGSGAFFAANDAARNQLQNAIDEREVLATTSGSQAYLRVDATAVTQPVAYAGLVKSGSSIFRLRAPADKPRLMMHAEAKAFLISSYEMNDPLASPLVADQEMGEAPSGAYSEEHIELRLKRLVGAFDVTNIAMEPYMEGALPFVTRFPRKTCDVLPPVLAERHPEITAAALLPLDGFWVLTARDGTTARSLKIDEGTTIRLLFQLDVPSGSFPWRLLEETTDVLYKLPEDGVCPNLQPIFGSWPVTSTFPPTTRTTLYTQTATTLALIPTTTRDPLVVVPIGEEDLVLVPRHSTEAPPAAPPAAWTPPVWLWAGLFICSLFACGFGVRFYIKRRRRRLREVLPEELEEGKGKGEVAPTILTQEARDGALRGAGDAKDNPYLAMAKKNAKKQASRKGSSWEISDTPRDKDEEAWSEASTPEGSEESGGSSLRSRSNGSHSSASSNGRPAVSPRTALAQKALQQHMQQFSPEQIAANALGGHARKFSADRIAADALEAHAAQLASQGLGAERGMSKTSKATAVFGPQKKHSKGSNKSIEEVDEGEKDAERLPISKVHIIAVVAICVGLLSLLANLLSPVKRGPAEILQNSAAALFAQVPEGLLPTVTISLMIASDQMASRNVIVRKIDAVETLGCVSVFCSDKTGTLTTGEMATQDLVVPSSAQTFALEVHNRDRDSGLFKSQKQLEDIALCGVLNNGAEFKVDNGEERWTGSPTEVAILRASAEVNGGPGPTATLKQRPEHFKTFEIPFNSENKWMLTIHGDQNTGYFAILKGAPERVMKYTTLQSDPSIVGKVEQQLQDLMGQGRRVLCIAKKNLDPNDVPQGGKFEGTNATDCNFPMKDFQFIGLYGIEDPPKKGVAEAVVDAQKAGVKVVMVTGDHPDTARAIASRINILGSTVETPANEAEQLQGSAEFSVITGVMLDTRIPKGDNFTDEEPEDNVKWWRKAVQHTRVFARVSPIHKQVIVQAYQKYGYNGIGDIVAMTGDGVNDAPALKQAEVGVAMGQRGTEVAKDASDIVLHDDNFSSVVKGMEQGRLSSENLQKSIMYTLCSKVPQVAPTFGELFGVPQALTVAQVLLIDIGTDIWTAIAYALQPAESKLMERPPRHPRHEKMVNCKVLVYSYGYIGQLQMLFCWLMFFWATPGMWELYVSGKTPMDYSPEDFQTDTMGMTVYYWTLVLGQIAAAVSTTTKLQSVLGFGTAPYCFPNTTLNLMFVGEVVMGLAAIYLQPIQQAFKTGWIPTRAVMLPVVAFVGITVADEIRKAIGRSLD